MLTATLSNNREIKIAHWFSEYGNKLVRFVRSKVNNITEAEDIAQDVWYQLTRQEDIENIEQIGAWLFTTARNRVFNFYKKKKNIAFSDLEEQNNMDLDMDSASTEDTNFNQWVSENMPGEWVESEEFWKILDATLAELPEEQRQVFIANELNDIPFKEISEKTGVSINTLLARKRYAVLKLRTALEKYT